MSKKNPAPPDPFGLRYHDYGGIRREAGRKKAELIKTSKEKEIDFFLDKEDKERLIKTIEKEGMNLTDLETWDDYDDYYNND